jgi:putative Mg2+ transporter-C (MgtC) family protein
MLFFDGKKRYLSDIGFQRTQRGCRSMWSGQAVGQGWIQVGELGLAFVLSALIGIEREIRQKSAGLRTYTLVGFASALIMLVSKYGFMNILDVNRVVVDPSRIAAQIVSGIGFIGGGLIFVRRDNVRGLTTAAIVWLTAAVGMACGAGLPILAIVVTIVHFVIVFAFPHVVVRLPRSRWSPSPLQLTYEDGKEVLREVLMLCTQEGFAVSRVKIERESSDPGLADAHADGRDDQAAPPRAVTVILAVQGVRSVSKLAAKLVNIDGVVAVEAGDANVPTD